MLTANDSRRRASNLLSMAVMAREAGDDEAADQLVVLASELFTQAARQEQPRPADVPFIDEAPPTAPDPTPRFIRPAP